MPFIQLNNANIYYEDEGKGDEIIVFGHSGIESIILGNSLTDSEERQKENARAKRF